MSAFNRKHPLPSREVLHDLLVYDEEAKVFRWRVGGKGRRPDRCAENLCNNVLVIAFKGIKHSVAHIHRIYFSGEPNASTG